MFFASEEPSTPPAQKKDVVASVPTTPEPSVDFITSEEEGFLNMVGSFLVDAFWLNSPHHQLGEEQTQQLDADIRLSLIIEQAGDLQDKYGEVMGKRLLDSCVIAALDRENKEMVGVVTLKATLLEKQNILEGALAEVISKNAVASLGPKQRREYKDKSVDVIATELLGPETKAICVLSNLAVSPTARRRGIAKALCDEAEIVARTWGYKEIYLLVEDANVSARNLYENKLGYSLAFTNEAETALRVDLDAGTFTEIEAKTLVLVKDIQI